MLVITVQIPFPIRTIPTYFDKSPKIKLLLKIIIIPAMMSTKPNIKNVKLTISSPSNLRFEIVKNRYDSFPN